MGSVHPQRGERGSALIEVLVAASILGIVGLAIAMNAMVALRFQKTTEVRLLAKNLAVSKAEELSGVFLDDLDDSFDEVEPNLSVGSHLIQFSRSTDITVEADGSRSVSISVSSTSPYLTTPVQYTTRFAPWES